MERSKAVDGEFIGAKRKKCLNNSQSSDSDELKQSLVVKVLKLDSASATAKKSVKQMRRLNSESSETAQINSKPIRLRRLRRKTPLRLAAERRIKYLQMKRDCLPKMRKPSELILEIILAKGVHCSGSDVDVPAVNKRLMIENAAVEKVISTDPKDTDQSSDAEVSFTRKVPCTTEQLPNSQIFATVSAKTALSSKARFRSPLNESTRKRLFKHKNRRSQIKFLTDGMTRYFQSEEGKRTRRKRLGNAAAAAAGENQPGKTESSDAPVWNQVKALTKLSRQKLATMNQSRAGLVRSTKIAKRLKFSGVSGRKRLLEPTLDQSVEVITIARQKAIREFPNIQGKFVVKLFV